MAGTRTFDAPSFQSSGNSTGNGLTPVHDKMNDSGEPEKQFAGPVRTGLRRRRTQNGLVRKIKTPDAHQEPVALPLEAVSPHEALTSDQQDHVVAVPESVENLVRRRVTRPRREAGSEASTLEIPLPQPQADAAPEVEAEVKPKKRGRPRKAAAPDAASAE